MGLGVNIWTLSNRSSLVLHCAYIVFVLSWCSVLALGYIQSGYESWSIHSPDCGLFHSVLAGVGPAIGQMMGKVIPILRYCTQPQQDPEMRLRWRSHTHTNTRKFCSLNMFVHLLRFITVLIQLILKMSEEDQVGVARQPFLDCSSKLVKEVFLPCAVWKPGRWVWWVGMAKRFFPTLLDTM